MTEATCRRELELEIPAADVQKAVDKVAKEFARVARIPGFRPGKAPVPLIRRRFADDIKGEVLQSLLPEEIDKAVKDRNLVPITRPQVDKVDFAENGPLKFRAVFEVLPEVELGSYKDLEVEVDAARVTDADVEKAIEDVRERSATFETIEGRPLADGDYAQVNLVGTPVDGGQPVKADAVLYQVGSQDTLAPFTENLRGAQVGEHRRFEVQYPADYPDHKLAGKSLTYAAEVLAVKQKKLPELNDEFARKVSEAQTVDELRAKVRQGMETESEMRQTAAVRDGLLRKLTEAHDFPVPEALVQHQMDARLERAVRSLAAQGVDPRGVNVDWADLREKQRERAVEDVKAELLLDRIATAEKIEVSDEDSDKEVKRIAERSGESAATVRASLTKEGTLDRMKSKLRSDKTLDWLRSNARVKTREAGRS
jgi:trigger factor